MNAGYAAGEQETSFINIKKTYRPQTFVNVSERLMFAKKIK